MRPTYPDCAPPQRALDVLRNAEHFLAACGVPAPRREAEALLCHFLSLSRMDLWLDRDRLIPSNAATRWRVWLTRRGRREPIQYITGEVAFCGRVFSVAPGVFIPRPETEFLVEAAKTRSPAPTRILDLCAGSGVLAVTLAHLFPTASVVASDQSACALSCARANARRHPCDRPIAFLQGDLFDALAPRVHDTRAGTENRRDCFDLIVSNPPYIARRDAASLPPEVREYEPHTALFGGEDGTAIYRRIFDRVGAHLAADGWLILELGDGQAAWLRTLAQQTTTWGHDAVTFLPDFSGAERVAICRKRSSKAADTERING